MTEVKKDVCCENGQTVITIRVNNCCQCCCEHEHKCKEPEKPKPTCPPVPTCPPPVTPVCTPSVTRTPMITDCVTMPP